MPYVLNKDWKGDTYEMEYEKLFLGECTGIALVQRGGTDLHVMVYILFEDDGTWHVSQSGRFSSHWLVDLNKQILAASKWMQENCREDEYGFYFQRSRND